MAKHKFTNSELAHAFFHQEDFNTDWGEGANFSFDGNNIYSYNSCIGIADFKRKIFKFRDGSFSNSTSKHQGYTRQAVPHDWKVYYWNNWSTFEDTALWFQERIDAIIEDKKLLKKGIKYFGNPDLIERVNEEFVDFAKTFNLKFTFQKYLKLLLEFTWTEEELYIHKVKTWCRDNAITGSYKTKVKVYNNPNLAAEVIEKNRIKKEKLIAAKEKEILEKTQKHLSKWYAGETNIFGFYRYNIDFYDIPVYLRVDPVDPKIVNTSKAANVPLVECALLYKKFLYCKNTGIEWKQNGDKFRIGYYNVEKIYKNETNNKWYLLAGCHNICEDQIEEFVTKFVPQWKKV